METGTVAVIVQLGIRRALQTLITMYTCLFLLSHTLREILEGEGWVTCNMPLHDDLLPHMHVQEVIR